MKRSWPNLRYYPAIYLEGMRRNTEYVGQVSRFLGRDLNTGLLRYKNVHDRDFR